MASYKLGFFVSSHDETHAKETAAVLLKELCVKRSGLDRGSIGSAVPVESPKGKEVVEQLFGWMWDAFQLDLAIIRQTLQQHSDDEILSGECRAPAGTHERCAVTQVRYHMHCLGMYEGPSVRLYDTEGNGIRTRSELDETLNQGETRLFVVTADAQT